MNLLIHPLYINYQIQICHPITLMTSYIQAFFRELSIAYTDNPGAPPSSTEPPPPNRFPIGDESSATLTLPDGRKLGYAQYGSLTGKPILFFHGLPGSRIDCAGFHDLGKELGARLVSIDRPGMGWSTPQPGRKLLDFPKDVEHLTEHLGLENYSLMVRVLPVLKPREIANK